MTSAGGLRRAALLLAVAAALYLPSVWTRDLWNPDEPRYAESVREMALRRDFILPHLNGGVYSEKPPLFFWLSTAAGAIPGVPPGAGGRLVSVLSAAATLLLTARLGTLLIGQAAGTLAALVLATSAIFWHLAQSGVIDPLLTALITAAILGFARHRAGRPGGILLFYLAAGFAVLAKGPVGFLIPALTAVTVTLIEEGPRGLKARHPWWGLPLAVLPVGLWLAAATARGGTGYAYTMIVKQNVGRAVNAYVHREPFWYFVPILPVAILPWILFLPQSFAAALRRRGERLRPLLLPSVWFAATFLMFSLISGKKTRYLLPLVPAGALLVGGWLARVREEDGPRLVRGRLPLLAGAAAACALAAAVAAPALGGAGVLPESLMAPLREPGSEAALEAIGRVLAWPGSLALLLPAALLAAGAAASLGLALRRDPRALPAFLLGWGLFLAVSGALWMPVANELKSARHLAEEIRPRLDGGPLHYLDNNFAGALNFYLGEESIPVLRKAPEIRAAWENPGSFFLASQENFARAEKKAGTGFEFLVCRRIGEEIFCLARPRRG